VTPDRRSPEYLASFIADEILKKAEIVKASGLSAD